MTKIGMVISRPWFTGLLLVATTILIFSPVAKHEFVTLDDPNFVTANVHVQQGWTWESVVWAFRPGHGDYWHPLTWLSHMLDVQWFGKSAAGPHLVNVLFHAANAVLVFLLFRSLTSATGRSAVVAGMFALHPLRAESVAWISERKDVLSLFFGLLSMLSYVRYAQLKTQRQLPTRHAPALSPSRSLASLGYYWLAVVFFTLCLMTKAMLVTLPCVLLLLDYWPLKRLETHDRRKALLRSFRLLLEKVPLFVLSAGTCLMTLLTAKKSVGVIEGLTFGVRMETAVTAYLWYIGKAMWPVNLAAMYPYPEGWPFWRVVSAGAMLVAISLVALRLARQRPYLVTGWFWYLGTLMPVIGLVQVGIQWVADRFTYFPLIGLSITLAWGGAEIFRMLNVPRVATSLIAGAILVVLALRTSDQLKHWKNSESLFTHTVAVTRNNYFAHNMLGCALMAKGEQELARVHFMEALRIRPSHAYSMARAYPHANLGDLFAQQGNLAEAKGHYEAAIEIDPSFAEIHAHLAQILTSEGEVEKGIARYREALRLKPDFPDALNNLAWILATCPDAKFRSGAKAVELAKRACELTTYQVAQMIGTLAAALGEASRFEEAVAAGELARSLALAQGQRELATRNAQLLELYRAGRPYREEMLVPTNKAEGLSPAAGEEPTKTHR